MFCTKSRMMNSAQGTRMASMKTPASTRLMFDRLMFDGH